jgi:hypothetical protein
MNELGTPGAEASEESVRSDESDPTSEIIGT